MCEFYEEAEKYYKNPRAYDLCAGKYRGTVTIIDEVWVCDIWQDRKRMGIIDANSYEELKTEFFSFVSRL